VDDCLLALAHDAALTKIPLGLIKKGIRSTLDQYRQRILQGEDLAPEDLALTELLRPIKKQILALDRPQFRRVINCTGVIIHTNLGRSILPTEAIELLVHTAGSYSNLEFDLHQGKRGSRYSLVEALLCELTGAEAALVVNNNAAAVLLALETLAKGQEVVVSRGQLVEIGGSFRIPEVMARSGAHLVEVGATNRTHLRDYREAIGPATRLLLKVHTSNYRIIGFTHEVRNEELVQLAHEQGLLVMEDLGSGCLLDLSIFGLGKEPRVQEVLASGVDLVTFSGDKLLGGPQAGIILGKRPYLEQIKKNPLNRALRIDKFTLASLEAVLRLYRDPQLALRHIPTLRMIATPVVELEQRAAELLDLLEARIQSRCLLETGPMTARVGGGALPEQDLASYGLRLYPQQLSLARLDQTLRTLDLPIIGRIEKDALILDMRTVQDQELSLLAQGLEQALGHSS
jgi:L-seryl-tRNA(Ser) seleniumtransferase